MDWKGPLIIALIITNCSVAFFYQDYWYDNEYPNGTIQRTIVGVEFFEDWYGYTEFVDFTIKGSKVKCNNCSEKFYKNNHRVFEVNDRTKNKILASLEHWNINFSNIPENKEHFFDITFHTEDRMGEGNEIWYYKQEVLDDFRVAGSHSWSVD